MEKRLALRLGSLGFRAGDRMIFSFFLCFWGLCGAYLGSTEKGRRGRGAGGVGVGIGGML